MYIDSEGKFHGSGDSEVWVRNYFSKYMSDSAKRRKPIYFVTKGKVSKTARELCEDKIKEDQEILEDKRVMHPFRMTELRGDFREISLQALKLRREFVEPLAAETFQRLVKFCLKDRFFQTVRYQARKVNRLVSAD